jgi:RimJ/RimL family protein N-acetyltransferase
MNENLGVDGSMAAALITAWPLFGLRLSCGDLTLRPITDLDAVGLADILERGIVPSGSEHLMPRLLIGRAPTRAERTRQMLTYHWASRANSHPEDWAVSFAVLQDGVLVGAQSVHAKCFPLLGQVHTGSYLATSAQGRGIGTRMRAMVVEWSFAHLGAANVTSGYVTGNHASAGVSAKLGYEPNGVEFCPAGTGVAMINRLLLTRTRWARFRPAWLDNLQVDGMASCRPLLGARPGSDGPTA